MKQKYSYRTMTRKTVFLFLKNFSVNFLICKHCKTSSPRLFNKLFTFSCSKIVWMCFHNNYQIDNKILIIYFQFLDVIRKLCSSLLWFVAKCWHVIVISLFGTLLISINSRPFLVLSVYWFEDTNLQIPNSIFL